MKVNLAIDVDAAAADLFVNGGIDTLLNHLNGAGGRLIGRQEGLAGRKRLGRRLDHRLWVRPRHWQDAAAHAQQTLATQRLDGFGNLGPEVEVMRQAPGSALGHGAACRMGSIELAGGHDLPVRIA